MQSLLSPSVKPVITGTQGNDNGNMNTLVCGGFYPSCGQPFTACLEMMKQ